MSKPLAILYFTRDRSDTAKDIAAAVRIEGNLVNMVFAAAFKGKEHCIKCEAVVIQASYGNSEFIADAYRLLWPEAEIHFYDDDGKFLDDGVAPLKPEPSTEVESEDENSDVAEEAVADTGPETDAVDPPAEQETETKPAKSSSTTKKSTTKKRSTKKKSTGSK